MLRVRLATEHDRHHPRVAGSQDRESIPGTFLCNWNLTLESQQEGRLIIYEAGNEPVAYQWGGLIQPGILEVRTDCRGTGIGRALVEHRLTCPVSPRH